jgi:hypothetical protein
MAYQPSDGVGDIPDEPVAPAGAWLNPKRGPYPEGAPLITEAPPDDSPLAYNEDEIVALWTQIYHIFIKIRHFKEREVIFPPEDTGRHPNIDRTRFRDEFGMSERAISLVERLPYTVKGTGGYWGQIFFPEGRIFDYLNFTHSSGMSVDCRQPHPGLADPSTVEFPPDRLLFPEDVALLDPVDWQGVAWILDTKTSEGLVYTELLETPLTAARARCHPCTAPHDGTRASDASSGFSRGTAWRHVALSKLASVPRPFYLETVYQGPMELASRTFIGRICYPCRHCKHPSSYP